MDANDTTCKMVNIYLYSRYERFWHWLQSALIVILLATGFETNGMLTLFGFKTAACTRATSVSGTGCKAP